MKERATIFFHLLSESYRIEAEERLHELNVAAYPHLKKDAAKQLAKRYEMVTRPPKKKVNPYDYSGIDRLKDIFEGKK